MISLPKLSFDYNLLHLQNPAAPSVGALYEVMDASKSKEAQISTIYASVVVDSIEQARDLAAKLEALPVVARVDSILPLLPVDQEAKLPVIQRIVKAASTLNIRPPSESAAVPVDVPRARRDIASLVKEALSAQQQTHAFSPINHQARELEPMFDRLVPSLERANSALNSAPEATIQKRFNPSSTGAFSRLQNNIELLKSQKADRGLVADDLPPQLKQLYLAADQKTLLQVYGKKDLWEREADKEFVEQVLTVAPQATGTPVLNYFATDLLINSYLRAAVWAFVAIVVLILLHFQSAKYLGLTLLPLLLAVLWRTGAMVWLGIQFNPANIVTLPLIIGIDVAFGIYIVDRFREDGRLRLFSGSTGKAIIMSSLTSLFGFVSLLIAQFRGVYDIGVLMSLGIAIGLFTSIVILPQVLSLISPIENEETKSTRP